MTVDELLQRLQHVKRTSSGKWKACCPAHPDKHPSLSIAQGHKAILLKCWSGCSLDQITARLGITVRDLFLTSRSVPFIEDRSAALRSLRGNQPKEVRWAISANIDACREAEHLIQSARSIDISSWSLERLNDVLPALADAYDLLWLEDYDNERRDRI